MICKHKFYEDLNLSYIDYNPEILIVGTFNPSWPEANYSKWFYGRTDANYFWDVLPRMFEGESLLTAKPNEWRAFCKRNKIALTDLIKEITCFDKENLEHKSILATYGDAEIIQQKKYLKFNSIDEILEKYTSIKMICFTRKLDKNWKEVWNECGVNDFSLINELFTPSRYASYATSKWRKENKFDKPMSVPDFIMGNWAPLFEKHGYNPKIKIEL